MRTVARVALIVGVLVMPRATWAAPPAMAELVTLLSDHETVPNAEAFVARGSSTADALFQIYASTQQPTFVRVRALRVLSYFPVSVAEPLLQQALRDVHAKTVFTREAALGLARCAGVRAVAVLTVLLQRTDVSTRRAAIEGLAQIQAPEALAELHVHRARETDPTVRRALDAALTATRVP